MKRPLVSILIVNWNGADIISSCLNSLSKQNYKNIEIIIVDNNSSDNSREIIKKFDKVKLIESKENLGFAQGNNVAFKHAKGEYILLLNTDTLVTKDFLEELVTILKSNPLLGVVQPKVLFDNDDFPQRNIINSIGAYLTGTGFLYYPGYGKKDTFALYNKQQNIFTAYGACMLIRKKVIEEIDLFDADFFMYFEETDFCMRVWLAGWKILYLPDSLIYHKGGVSSKKFGLEKIYFHSFKNRICTYLKNLELGTLLKILPIHILICEVTSILYLVTGKVDYFWAIQKAFFWNIYHFKETLKKRKIIQRVKRKVKDKEYLSIISRSPRLSYYLYLFKGLQYYKDY